MKREMSERTEERGQKGEERERRGRRVGQKMEETVSRKKQGIDEEMGLSG